jgi:hypothetical protein
LHGTDENEQNVAVTLQNISTSLAKFSKKSSGLLQNKTKNYGTT